MAVSIIPKQAKVKQIILDNIPATTDAITVSYPSGFTSSNCAFVGAKVKTKYNSVVDWTYDNGAYFGDIYYLINDITKFQFTPRVAGNAQTVWFYFASTEVAT